MFTEFYATTNARALMHFCSLRSAKEAQYEIRQASLALEQFLAQRMPVTYAAFCDNGKVAP
jgi:thymidylate synthase (FAD)